MSTRSLGTFELKTYKDGKTVIERLVTSEYNSTIVQYKVSEDRRVSEIGSELSSRVYKKVLCPYHVVTRELDYNMLDDWVITNLTGLWWRGGFSVYYFEHDHDAVLFKLTWGIIGEQD